MNKKHKRNMSEHKKLQAILKSCQKNIIQIETIIQKNSSRQLRSALKNQKLTANSIQRYLTSDQQNSRKKSTSSKQNSRKRSIVNTKKSTSRKKSSTNTKTAICEKLLAPRSRNVRYDGPIREYNTWVRGGCVGRKPKKPKRKTMKC